MNIPSKLIACSTAALLAAALGAQAQTSSTNQQLQPSTSANSSSTQSNVNQNINQNTNQQSTLSPSSSSALNSSDTSANAQPNSGSTSTSNAAAGSFNGSASGTASGSLNTSGSANTEMSTPTAPTDNPASSSVNNANSTSSNNTASSSTNLQSNVATQNNVSSTTTVSDAQVTTFVQQLDAQGPAVVEQITPVVGGLACSQDTIQNLVDALHTGKSVTITSDANGQQKSATFNASGAHLGYGEAYIALALAAQELNNAGITSCATPDQWQAVLFGGPIASTSTTTVASGSSSFPGIVTLHTQGQGWGQIAQSSNLQLGEVINRSSSSAGAPTGYSSAEMHEGHPKADADHDNDEHKGEKKHWWDRFKDKDHDKTHDQDKADANKTDSDTSPKTNP